jgi:hypothetical protein
MHVRDVPDPPPVDDQRGGRCPAHGRHASPGRYCSHGRRGSATLPGTLHSDYFGRKTDDQFAAYCAAKPHNAVSLDGLPALPLPLPARSN